MESVFFTIRFFFIICLRYFLSVDSFETAIAFQKNNNNKNSSVFQIVNEWKYLDFEYPTFVERQAAITNG